MCPFGLHALNSTIVLIQHKKPIELSYSIAEVTHSIMLLVYDIIIFPPRIWHI